jgi:tetratricopeptide (TPR) repeat protein
MVALEGDLYEMGERLTGLPFPDELTFYISSLSSLADLSPRYRMTIVERMVYDNTKALIDFEVGKSAVDTLLGDNASELLRVRKCIESVLARDDLELDSLVVVASCSPEGSYESNRRLSEARSLAVLEYIGEYVPEEWRDSLVASSLPENWTQLALLVENDTVISPYVRRQICAMIESMTNPDRTERELAKMPDYRYMREKLYPQLRSVKFDFYLHRKGMQKDTVHTTEIDSAYMAGVKALTDLDYKRAVSILRPYDDYNAALAFMSADYNHSALDVLGRLDDHNPKVCYLKAMVLVRLGQLQEALKYYDLCVAYDPYMEHRANLDPEMHELMKLRKPF